MFIFKLVLFALILALLVCCLANAHAPHRRRDRGGFYP